MEDIILYIGLWLASGAFMIIAAAVVNKDKVRLSDLLLSAVLGPIMYIAFLGIYIYEKTPNFNWKMILMDFSDKEEENDKP